MKFNEPIYIIQGRRSAIGRLGGGFKSTSAADLASAVSESIVPASLKPKIDHVILGQALQSGSGMNVARQLASRIGLPQATPAFTTNMVCGSGLKAIAMAASSIALGESSLVLAGGVESMSRLPHYLMAMRWGSKFGNSVAVDAILADGLIDPILNITMGQTVERIADEFKISREEQDQFAWLSQQKAAAHRLQFESEITPIHTPEGIVAIDEHPRSNTTREQLAQLKPAFCVNGTVTAGNASGLNDGAAMLLIASATVTQQLLLAPHARIVATVSVGCDPALMGLGPVAAIRLLCENANWRLEDVDAIEINEAFAVQTLACARELRIDPEKLNRWGGAIALGHPIGCSGARILVTLMNILATMKLKRGIASLCIGGGMGIAIAIELHSTGSVISNTADSISEIGL